MLRMILDNRPFEYNTGFWCAVASAILASLNAVVLVVYAFWLRKTAWKDNRRIQVQGRHFVVCQSGSPSIPKASHAKTERQLSELFLFWIIAIWALIFSRIENWEYFNAIYFCVVTTLTVGFGDCESLLLSGGLARGEGVKQLALQFSLIIRHLNPPICTYTPL